MPTDLVIDADGHCNEPWEDLTPWMPEEYHHQAPVGFNDRHGTSRMYVEGRLSTRTEGLGSGVSGPFAPHIRGGRPRGRDARQRLTDMDQEGIDVAIIFGTRVALSVNGLRPQWHLCQRNPSEIIASGQVALTCEPEEEILPYVLDTMGSHLIMYASDYPHWDCEFPKSVRLLASIPGLTDEQKRRVLGRNAIAWFGLTPAEIPSTSVYFPHEEALAASGA